MTENKTIDGGSMDKNSKGPAKTLLIWLLPWLLGLGTWAFIIVKDTVQAQVVDDIKVMHEMPVTKVRVENLESDLKDIKVDLREQRGLIQESQKDIKYLIKKFDTSYGNR